MQTKTLRVVNVHDRPAPLQCHQRIAILKRDTAAWCVFQMTQANNCLQREHKSLKRGDGKNLFYLSPKTTKINKL